MRVDRGHSSLGNPYVLRAEHERDAVCTAYDVLLAETLDGPHAGGVPEYRVAEIGRSAGVTLPPRAWDSAAVHGAISCLRERVARGERLVLQCHCAPRRCHATSVRRQLIG